MARTGTKNPRKTDARIREEAEQENREAREHPGKSITRRYGGKSRNAEAYLENIENKQGYERGKLVSPEANDTL